MSRTATRASKQVYSGFASPISVTPADPSSAAVYYQFDSSGSAITEYVWPAGGTAWVALPMVNANWSDMEALGWEGYHNDPGHYDDPAFTPIHGPCTVLLTFGVDSMSTSTLQFEIYDKLTNAVLATGSMPPGLRSADPATVSLMDAAGNPTVSLTFSGPTQIAARPVGGYAAAPADGYGFSVSGRIVY